MVNGFYTEDIFLEIYLLRYPWILNYKVGKKECERVMGSNEINVHDILEQKCHCENNHCTINVCYQKNKKLEKIKYKLPAT